MGYYAAGGNVAWAPPAWDTLSASTSTARAPLASVPAFGQPFGPADQGVPGYEPRKRRQVIDLTALRRAERRIDRATRVFSRLYRAKKQGHHGLLFKKKRRAR